MLTEKEVQILKEKHGTIYTVEVPINEEETEFATIYLKRPDRMFYSMYNKIAEQRDEFKSIEASLKYLYVGGDSLDVILKNDDAILACDSVLAKIVQRKQATLKKN